MEARKENMESQSGCSQGDIEATLHDKTTDMISTGTSQKYPSEKNKQEDEKSPKFWEECFQDQHQRHEDTIR